VHSNEIMNINELPKKYFAYTQCFRGEAGSSREEERGTIRGHQFNKVEMVQYVTEDKTEEAFNELLNIAEGLMKKFRTSLSS
jgi:seryl-tRNA synthetase